MAEYNLSEFRANTRKAFDEAERGEPVYIERYGEDFILISKKNWGEMVNAQTVAKPAPEKNIVESATDESAKAYSAFKDKPYLKKNNSLPQAESEGEELPGIKHL